MGEIIADTEIVENLKPSVDILILDNSVKGKYTTADLVAVDTSTEKFESKKIVLSNDAFAICQLLETFVNKMGRL